MLLCRTVDFLATDSVILHEGMLYEFILPLTDSAVDTETKDETEEPVDLIPTLIPLPPDEVCFCTYIVKIVCCRYFSLWPIAMLGLHCIAFFIAIQILYTVSQKKTVKIVFVITASNFHQL